MGLVSQVKAVWADPRKRPWVIGGAGVASGAAFLALRRPADPDEAAAEDRAVSEMSSADPTLGAVVDDGMGSSGMLPGVVFLGGGSGYGMPDPAFMEADLSGVYAAIDEVALQQQGAIDEAVSAATERLRGRNRRLSQRQKELAEQQAASKAKLKKTRQQLRRTKQRVNRLENRAKPRRPRSRTRPRRQQRRRVA